MHLPISINSLLQDSVVESYRIEFKESWNPESIMKTICAFSNDFQNFGGGYIVVGVKEVDGTPVLPPAGVKKTELDKIQKDLVRICSFIKPNYFPITSIENYKSKFLFVIWAPGGFDRPYTAPKSLGKNEEKDQCYYIRKNSSTVIAKTDERKELISLTATIPFDDRINHRASMLDIKLPLIQSFLKEVDSALLKESSDRSLEDLCRQMAFVDGGNEYLKPRNIALLFFNDHPEKFFPYIRIDVVYFPEGEGGDVIQEEIFEGPLDHQLRSALRYIKNSFISEKILKIPGQAESKRFFNYPYEAIEEALVNAVYHRSYEIREPIEVRVNRDNIRIVSHPGADHSIPLEDVKKGKMLARRYRNRRIGEFLKELDFTEGRGTGLPKMKHALERNGSPKAIFHTDEARTYFYTEIQIHADFLEAAPPTEALSGASTGASTGASQVSVELSETESRILQLCAEKPMARAGIVEALGHKSLSGNIKQALRHLKETSFIEYTIPDKPSSKKQQYKITEFGLSYLNEENTSFE